jgi:hypothetical protein
VTEKRRAEIEPADDDFGKRGKILKSILTGAVARVRETVGAQCGRVWHLSLVVRFRLPKPERVQLESVSVTLSCNYIERL